MSIPNISYPNSSGSDSSDSNLPVANSTAPTATAPRSTGLQHIKALGLWRSIGHGLFLFALVDLIYAVIPPKFTDPVWEFQTIGDWFERVPVLMLGLMLIFYREWDFRRPIERQLLPLLSWLTIPLGLCFLLLLPLCASDAVQINRLNNSQINTQLNEQTLQVDQAKSRLLSASQADLETLLLPEEQAAQIETAPRTAQAAKEVALDNIEAVEKRAQDEAAQARQSLKRNLLKNTVRLMLGCLVSAMLLFYVWRTTGWARDPAAARQGASLPTGPTGSPKPGRWSRLKKL